MCRRTAERELRKVAQRLRHFESVVEQLRVDVAAFGRSGITDDSGAGGAATQEMRSNAARAVARAGGVLAFLEDSDDPLAVELRALHEAVEPLHAE
jgi:hypothetical protein